MFGNSVVGRFAGLLGQWALGWLLVPEEFGVYALAVSTAAIVTALRNGGATNVLISRGGEYEQLAAPYLSYALAFNTCLMVILAVAAPLIHTLFEVDGLRLLLLCMAVSIPIGTVGAILRAKLTIDQHFKRLAMLGATSAVVWHASVVLMAVYGCGVISFGIGAVIQALFESVSAWWVVRAIPAVSPRIDRAVVMVLIRKAKWVMLSAIALALATSGDYVAVGIITDNATLGIYFFSFQIVVSIAALLNGSFEAVFPTMFTRIRYDRHAQRTSYMTAVRMTILVAVPLATCFIFVAAPIIDILWNGKWGAAISPIQILGVNIVAWLVVSLSRAIFEANELWQGRFWFLVTYGVGGICAAGMGALRGGVEDIALFVTVFYGAFSVGSIVVVIRHYGEDPYSALSYLAKPFVLHGVAICAALGFVKMYGAGWGLDTVGIKVALFLLVEVTGSVLLFQNEWTSMISVYAGRGRASRDEGRHEESDSSRK